MLTAEQSTLLSLVRTSLWGEALPDKPETAMGDAEKQALVPLAYPGSPEAAKYSAHYLRVLFAQDELTALFHDAKIQMTVLKGSAAAIYYPDPFLRTMGDIDIIVPNDYFAAAKTMLRASGYESTCKENEDGRHLAFSKDGIITELHHHFSLDGQDVEAYALATPVEAELVGHRFPMLPSLENGIILLTHLAQHLRVDLGLRQVIDWMMYVHAVLDDEFWEQRFHSAASDCGLVTLAITATRMCQLYLGLSDTISWCAEADETLCAAIMENILTTGNFGRGREGNKVIENVTTGFYRKGLLKTLQRRGEENWMAYQQHHWLKPLCWLYQAGRYVERGFRSSSNIVGDIRRSRDRYTILRRLGID